MLPAAWPAAVEAQLIDVAGRVVRVITPTTRDLSLPRGALPVGIYLLKFPGHSPVRVEFR